MRTTTVGGDDQRERHRQTLTVCIPTLPGREALLERAWESASLQDPDAILIYMDSLLEGPAATRNRMLDDASTGWVLMLDDDDYLLPHYWETVSSVIRDHPEADLVYTGFRVLLPGGRADDDYFDMRSVPFAEVSHLLSSVNWIPSCVTVRTEKAREARYDTVPSHHEDWSFLRRLRIANATFVNTEKVCWVYDAVSAVSTSDGGRPQ